MLHRDLSEFIALLNAERVEYLVVGAHALAYYGRPRFTGDLDLWVRRTPENAAGIVRVLDAFGFSALGVRAGDFLKPDTVVQLGTAPNRIDLLTDLEGLTFEAAWAARTHGTLGAHDVAYLSREDLIRNKRALGRAKDLADIDALQ